MGYGGHVTQADRIPRIRKLDPCPCAAPRIWRTWTAVWVAMGEPAPKRDRWRSAAIWADRAGANARTTRNLLGAAHRQGLVRKRTNRDGHIVFARTDAVAVSWSDRESAAFDLEGWRWWPSPTC